MPNFARRLAAVLVALLSLAIVAVLVLRASGAPIALGPSAEASPSASPPSSIPTGTPAPSREASEVYAEIEAQVVELRGLPAAEIGPPDVITRAQLADELEEMLDQEWTEDELRRSNVTLRAMGLLGEGQDIRQLAELLLADQVIGFYDPVDRRMVVVSDAGLTVQARITYAHEYTHALQDAAFDTFARREELADDDAILARQALEEGDAVAVMFQWALANLTPGEMQEVFTTPVPDMTGIPGWMVSQLNFPYLAGLRFVTTLGTLGEGSAAVNDAYRNPPASTEQVLHPEKYVAGEEPIDVDAPQLAASFGRGWEDLEPTTMGEAMIDFWLNELGADEDVATTAAAGWGGDRLIVASGLNQGWAMAWRIAWDSVADADEFEAAYAQTDAGPGIAARLVRASETETLVLHAPSVEVLDVAAAAFVD